MRVMAQMGMVMNLDKCIGCHTCSVTCKQAWTNRSGTEYVWFNNVETRPGQGYPRRYEDQDTWRGGWMLNSRGRLKLKAGGRVRKLLGIFASPVQPKLADYYEPWTYDYRTLINAPLGDDFPVARPKSLITGEDTKITWSANWDDDLGGASEMGHLDPIVQRVRRESEDKIKFEFEQTFMFYLPRICEHCLNPSCMASCPSGAIYKRAEDGIVLVDQDRCRGWRQCVTGCPYKKIYFNHKTGKAEKCTPVLPPDRGRAADGVLGDLRRTAALPGPVPLRRRSGDRGRGHAERERPVLRAAGPDLGSQKIMHVVAAARRQGIPADWLEAARRSPVYALAKKYKVALPLHPEYRTMPMVWYIPPLSPIVDLLRDQGHDAESTEVLFGAIRVAAHSVGVPGRAVHGGRRRRDRARAFGTGGHARPHAQHHPRAAAGRLHRRLGGDDRPEYARDVPPDGHREVRRALRDPEGSRRAGPRARGAGLLARLRQRTVRVRTVRRGQWAPVTGGRGDLPGASATADLRAHRVRRATPRPGEPAQLGRQREHPRACSRTPKEQP